MAARTSPLPYALPCTIATVALALIGFLFFHIAAFSCKTFQFNGGEELGIVKAGYWGYNMDGGCNRYPAAVDGVTHWGRFVGVFGSLLAWPILMVAGALLCIKVPRFFLFGAGIGSMMVSMLSFFLLSGQSSGKELQQGPGGILAIFSALLWAGAGLCFLRCLKDKESNSEFKENEGQDRELLAGDSEGEDGSPDTTKAKKVGIFAALGLAGAAAGATSRRGKGKSKGDDEVGGDDTIENADRDIEAGVEDKDDGEYQTTEKKGFFSRLSAGRKKKNVEDDGNDAEENAEADVEGGAEDDADEEDTVKSSTKKRGILAGMGLAGLAAGATRKKKETRVEDGGAGEDAADNTGQDDVDNEEEGKPKEKKSRGMFGRRKKNVDQDDEKSAGGEDEEDGEEDDNEDDEEEKPNKSKGGGLLAGLGLAGLAAGAGSRVRKKKTTSNEDDVEDEPANEAEEDEDNENSDDKLVTTKKKKRGLFSGKRSRNKGKDSDDMEVGEDAEAGEGDGKGDTSKDKSNMDRGILAGMGMAGLAAGAGARRSRKSGDEEIAEEAEEDKVTEKKKRGLFKGFGRKKENKDNVEEEEEEEGAFPKSPTNSGEEVGGFPTSPATSADPALEDAPERDLSAIVEEGSVKTDDEEAQNNRDTKGSGSPNPFLALLGIHGTKDEDDSKPTEEEVQAAVANTDGVDVLKTAETADATPPMTEVSSRDVATGGAVIAAAAGTAAALGVSHSGENVVTVNDDDQLCATDDENEALEKEADESFDRAVGDGKKKGLRGLLGRKADSVVEVSETMSVDVGPDGKRIKTITTTKIMSSGTKTIKTRVEPVE